MVTALFCGAVTASAADTANYKTDIYVDGFYNTEGDYCLRIGNFGASAYTFLMNTMSEAGVSPSECYFNVWLHFDDTTVCVMTLPSQKTKSGEISTSSVYSIPYIYDETNGYQYISDQIQSARIYINSTSDDGIVCFLPQNSPFLERLASAKTIGVQSLVNAGGKTSFQDNEIIYVKPDFKDLEEKNNRNDDDTIYIKSPEYNGSIPELYILKKDGYVGFAYIFESGIEDKFFSLLNNGKFTEYDFTATIKNCGKYDFKFYGGGNSDEDDPGIGFAFWADNDNAPEIKWELAGDYPDSGRSIIYAWVKEGSAFNPPTNGKIQIDYYYYLKNGNTVYWGDPNKTYSIDVKMTTFDSAQETKMRNTSKDINDLTFSAVSDKAYTGKARKPDVTIKDGSYKLVYGTDYTLSFKNNTNIGKATITVKGKGNYTGTKTVTFNIIPPKTTVSAARSGEKINLKWGAVNGIDKYQIYYSTDGGKTYKKAGNVSGTKTSCSLALPSGTTYTIRMRSYKKVGTKTYYSQLSKAVTV